MYTFFYGLVSKKKEESLKIKRITPTMKWMAKIAEIMIELNFYNI